MAGKQHEEGLAQSSCAKSVRKLALLGLSSTVALAMGCSDLDDSSQTYCVLNPDVGSCALEGVPDVNNPWWCMGQPQEVLPQPRANTLVGFVQPVLDWSSRQPLAGRGLTASLCLSVDSGCARPIALPTIGATQQIQSGMLGPMPIPADLPGASLVAGVLVPEGFDGFIKFNMALPPTATLGDQFLPDAYYLGGEISGTLTTAGPILMLNNAARSTILLDSFKNAPPGATDQRGILAVSTYDCNGDVVSGGRVEVQVGGAPVPDAIPFQVPASRIPLAQPSDKPLFTSASGLAGFLNVPAGTVEVIAYRPGTDDRFGSIVMGSVGGQLSLGPIRPDYRRNASVLRPAAADMMMGAMP